MDCEADELTRLHPHGVNPLQTNITLLTMLDSSMNFHTQSGTTLNLLSWWHTLLECHQPSTIVGSFLDRLPSWMHTTERCSMVSDQTEWLWVTCGKAFLWGASTKCCLLTQKISISKSTNTIVSNWLFLHPFLLTQFHYYYYSTCCCHNQHR